MKNIIANLLSAGGLIGILYYSYRYYEDSSSIQALGVDVVMSEGDYVPILISLVILLVGLVLLKRK